MLRESALGLISAALELQVKVLGRWFEPELEEEVVDELLLLVVVVVAGVVMVLPLAPGRHCE